MKVDNVYSESLISKSKEKIKTLESFALVTKAQCIFTKGVFDLLHYGHLSLFAYLNNLKQETNYFLVVGITSDKLVKEKKGVTRPINPESERALQISLLSQVDYVFINEEHNLSTVITALQPKIFVKGIDTIQGGLNDKLLFENNPEFKAMDVDSSIVIFSDNQSISTSDIIRRITNKF